MTGAEPRFLLDGSGPCTAWTAIRVDGAEDLTRRRDLERLTVGERRDAAVGEQASFLERLLGLTGDDGVGLRYLRRHPGRIEVYLVGRTGGAGVGEAVRRAEELTERLLEVPRYVAASPLRGAAAIADVLRPFRPGPQGLAQIHKRIRTAAPERPDSGVLTYLAVEPFAQERTAWEPLLTDLLRYPHPIGLAVDLVAARVPDDVRQAIGSEATRFRRLGEPVDRISPVGAREQIPADRSAVPLEDLFGDALVRYADRAFHFTVTVASPQPLDRVVVQRIAATISPTTPAAAPVPDRLPVGHTVVWPADAEQRHRATAGWTGLRPEPLPDPALITALTGDRDAARHGLRGLRVLVDTAEALSVFRFPIAADGVVPGFPVFAPRDDVRVVDEVRGRSVVLGFQDPARPDTAVRMPVGDLARHAFVVGTPGSGKTNTALHLCRELWTHGIPFMVIEPVNAELDDYRWLATLDEFADLLVFTVGDESTAPFRLNPFQVPTGMTVAAHISGVLACFEAAFGLWDPLPFIYRRALVLAYRRRGFHGSVRGSAELVGRWPVLGDVVTALAEVVGDLDYRGDVGANIDAAARLRAESLVEGSCGSTLSCRRSFDVGALLRRPVVLELAAIGDNAKEQALFTLLMLNAVRSEFRATRPRSGESHVMLLEEAHRIFPRVGVRGGDEREADASALAAERIAQGLAEDRKYREAYVLIDQQVGKVAEDAYKITNLKVLHRTSDEEDRRLLGATMAMHADQIDVAGSLRPFQAVVSHNGLDRAVTVDVPDVRRADAARRGLAEAPLADDTELRRRHGALTATGDFHDAMAPFVECEGCRSRCAFRSEAADTVALWAGDAASLFPVDGSVDDTSARLVELSGADSPEDRTMCLFVHAFRAVYPPARWRPGGAGQDNAAGWARRVRSSLRLRDPAGRRDG